MEGKMPWNALAVIAVAVLFHRAPNLATAEQCNDSPIVYSGRFFQMTAINHTDSMTNLSTPSVYACNHMCNRTSGCIALQYNKSTETPSTNCKLYNLTNVQKYFIDDPESDGILRLPITCELNSTVNGNWLSWQQAGACSVSCGSGLQNFTRSCVDPAPSCNGDGCEGPDTKTEPCQTQECAKWSAWSVYGACSVSCESGTKERTRICNGAGECDPGPSSETTTCDAGTCPEWNAWSYYRPCSVACGLLAEVERTRTCSVDGECHSGSSSETRPCVYEECIHRLLRHYMSGLCLAYDSYKIVLTYACDQRFQMIDGRIYKAETMECLKPITATANSLIELTTACEDPLCEFQVSSSSTHFPIGNKNTSMCFHQNGGSPTPGSGTDLLLNSPCHEDRVKYYWN